MSFVEYLIDKGYKPNRKVYDRVTKQFQYVECDNVNYFSSCAPGYEDIRLLKDNQEIIYGLHEYGHPPVLIYPRLECKCDSEMDRVFMNNSYDQIYSMLMHEK